MMKAAMAYTYAGGFAEGARPYFTIEDHYEDPQPYGADTVHANDPTINIHAGDWAPSEYVDVIFSNPPCAPFSPAGYGKGKGAEAWRLDPRLKQHEAVAWLGAETDAAVIVLESVRQSLKAKEFYDALTKRYLPNHELFIAPHNAKYHGIPQDRKRVFWIWSTVELDLHQPDIVQTLQPCHVNKPEAPMIRTLNPNTMQILPRVPPGARLRPYWNHPAGVRGIPSAACRRLAFNEPTPAMSGVRGFVHPSEDRYITLPELRTICGYDPRYTFQGKPQAQVLQMVRAVLPPVASWIASRVHQALR